MRGSAASSFRKIAVAIWRRPLDPTVHGILEVDMTGALAYLDRLRSSGAGRPTVTHLIVRAVALALARNPEANARVRFRRVWLRDSIDVFVQVALDEGNDLSGILVRNADTKSLLAIDAEVRAEADKVRRRDDALFGRVMGIVRFIPGFVLSPLLAVAEFLSNAVGLHLPALGIARRPFGSAMVTSVGMFGIEYGFAPFFPLADTPLLVCVGRVQDRPAVVEGRIEVRPICPLGATLDHRLVDGVLAGRLAQVVRDYLARPEEFEPPPPSAQGTPSGG
ncbi:MAG: 2-oxo acid dehydrogenase subunit E2 [Planctomycetes bacterium]|nr:2-oxo acid dehydrogenase subunit E2 [Planctomycetota bacterium]